MSGGKGETGASKDLSKVAKKFYKESTPLRRELQNQMLEALITGGVGARVPIINKAVEQSKLATSRTLKGTDESLAASGLAGTPFGERTRAGVMQAGEQQTAMVPVNMIMSMLQQIPGYVTGTNRTVVQGLTGAAGTQAQQAGAEAAYLGSLMRPFGFGYSIRR